MFHSGERSERHRALRCGGCGRTWSRRARYCGRCGAPLDHREPTAPRPAPGPRAVRWPAVAAAATVAAVAAVAASGLVADRVGAPERSLVVAVPTVTAPRAERPPTTEEARAALRSPECAHIRDLPRPMQRAWLELQARRGVTADTIRRECVAGGDRQDHREVPG